MRYVDSTIIWHQLLYVTILRLITKLPCSLSKVFFTFYFWHYIMLNNCFEDLKFSKLINRIGSDERIPIFRGNDFETQGVLTFLVIVALYIIQYITDREHGPDSTRIV